LRFLRLAKRRTAHVHVQDIIRRRTPRKPRRAGRKRLLLFRLRCALQPGREYASHRIHHLSRLHGWRWHRYRLEVQLSYLAGEKLGTKLSSSKLASETA